MIGEVDIEFFFEFYMIFFLFRFIFFLMDFWGIGFDFELCLELYEILFLILKYMCKFMGFEILKFIDWLVDIRF